MGKIIDFTTGKEITSLGYDNINELHYDDQDLFNSQVLTLLHSLVVCLEMDEEYKKQFMEVISSANNSIERIIVKKNNLE